MTRRAAAFAVMVLLAAALFQQGAAAAGPAPNAKVLDIVSHVEDMSGKVESTTAEIRDMSAKINTMVGANKNIAVKQSPTEVRIELAADVLFDFDSAQIQAKARPSLARIAKFIGTSAKGQVRILGYTDGKGSATYNQGLSERRAKSVKRWFVENDGLRNVNFATQGLGARNPVAPNRKRDGSDNPEGRKKNRRVEIIVHK
ncbi:MAG TPA: OmpA family protein [Dongiaceae bacterium]|nr:OmpA family protein [Dongiaceae bacterium]